jgi:hypothetical protein
LFAACTLERNSEHSVNIFNQNHQATIALARLIYETPVLPTAMMVEGAWQSALRQMEEVSPTIVFSKKKNHIHHPQT